MLRVILATLGVALIAFGLFGGKSLEQVYAGLNGVVERFSGGDDSQLLTADTSMDSTEQQAETILAAGAANQVSQSVNQATDSSTVASVELSGTQQSTENDLAVKTDSDSKLDIANVEQTGQDGGPIIKASVENGAERNSDDSAAMQEVKASARNKELELALASKDIENAELQKEADVGEILQTTAGSSSVEALFVLKDLVNMRQGPSIEHPVVLRLEKGQELMEFKREGKWVHVGAYGTAGKIGWVHERLVGKTPG